MKNNKYSVLAGVLLSYCAVAVVQAATVSLSPASRRAVNLGESFTLDLVIDFSDAPTLGGGIDINYESNIVDFIGFEFNSDFQAISDPLLTCPGARSCLPIDQVDKVENIVFGTFLGIGGNYTVGTLTYELNSFSFTNIFPTVTTASGGPFVSATTNQPMDVFFSGVSLSDGIISQDTPIIPIPPSIWLFVTALLPLFIKRQKLAKYSC